MTELLPNLTRTFAHPVTAGITLAIAAVLAVTPLILMAPLVRRRADERLNRELWSRYLSWLVIAPFIALPILLGPLCTVIGVCLLSLICYREYARATGLFRERAISLVIVIGILLTALAALDRWYELFVALFPLITALIVVVAILPDQPRGYIQRVALGVFAFVLFGSSMGHLAYYSVDRNYQPILLMILAAVQLNDVFAFIVGKTLGRRKLAPNTSPGKTAAGSIGAAVLTTAIVCWLGHLVFRDTELDRPLPLVALGLIVGIVGQFGDLMLSSIKRDLGIKDMGAAIPGHGGVLDRFNSTILVAPATFHFIGYIVGLGVDQPRRIFTGG